MNLIVSTLKKEDTDNKKLMKLFENRKDIEVIYTEEKNIKACIGCNRCWLITPGICAIKDDQEEIIIKMLKAKKVLFVTETKLGFVSFQMKNVIDRLLPLLTMYLKFKDGQTRHVQRYQKEIKMSLVYKGEADEDFLVNWFERAVINYGGVSLGTYKISDKEGISNAFTNR